MNMKGYRAMVQELEQRWLPDDEKQVLAPSAYAPRLKLDRTVSTAALRP